MSSFSDDGIVVVSKPTIEELSEVPSLELVEVLFDINQEMDVRFDAALALRMQTDKPEAVMDKLFAKVDESTKPLGAGHEAFQVQKTGKMAAIALQNHWVGSEKIATTLQDWVLAGVRSNREETSLLQANDMLRKQREGRSKLWLPESAKEEVPPAYDENKAREFDEAGTKLVRALTILAGSEAELASGLIAHVLRERMLEDTYRIFALDASAGNDSLIISNTLVLLLTDRKTSDNLRDQTLKLLEAYCPNDDKFREFLGKMRDLFAREANKFHINPITKSDLTALAKRFENILANPSSPERKHSAIENRAYAWRVLMHMEDPHGCLSRVYGSNIFVETRLGGIISGLTLSKKIIF